MTNKGPTDEGRETSQLEATQAGWFWYALGLEWLEQSEKREEEKVRRAMPGQMMLGLID